MKKVELKELSFNKIKSLMESLGFEEASIVKHPVVPGPDGFDLFFYRESDGTLVQISYSDGSITERGGWILRFKRNYKRGDEPEYEDVQDYEGEISPDLIVRAINRMLNELIKRCE